MILDIIELSVFIISFILLKIISKSLMFYNWIILIIIVMNCLMTKFIISENNIEKIIIIIITPKFWICLPSSSGDRASSAGVEDAQR